MIPDSDGCPAASPSVTFLLHVNNFKITDAI